MNYLAILIACLAATAHSQNCKDPETTFYADDRQCDKYYECVEGVPEERLCPDGLVFADKLVRTNFPCEYPTEVDCSARPQLQPAQPTEHCGRAWGYFNSGDRANCGTFWNCVDQREFQFSCPEGLAFSSATYRCEWPENSEDCDAHAFLGFTCPAIRDESQLLLVGTPRYSSPRDCRKYFLCVGDNPRLHTCDLGTVFNDAIHGCDEPENVQGCSSYYPADELAAIRERRAKSKLARERKQLELQERIAQLNSNKRVQ